MRAAAEAEDADALRAIEDEIGDLGTASPELPVDLLLAYRDVSAWADMIRCVEAMPATTREVVTVREQHALALNRRNGPGDRKQALKILPAVLERYGPSPETCGILGRCYKDAWQQATDAELKALALDEAIEATAWAWTPTRATTTPASTWRRCCSPAAPRRTSGGWSPSSLS